jgi:hypothetical protein
MKLLFAPILGGLVAFFVLFWLLIIFNALTEPSYEPCATERDAGREWANTGHIRKNDAGQYLCPVRSK